MAFYDIDTLNNNPALIFIQAEDFADLAFVLAGDNFYFIVLFNVAFTGFHKSLALLFVAD
jgi:hypothetical protein